MYNAEKVAFEGIVEYLRKDVPTHEEDLVARGMAVFLFRQEDGRPNYVNMVKGALEYGIFVDTEATSYAPMIIKIVRRGKRTITL